MTNMASLGNTPFAIDHSRMVLQSVLTALCKRASPQCSLKPICRQLSGERHSAVWCTSSTALLLPLCQVALPMKVGLARNPMCRTLPAPAPQLAVPPPPEPVAGPSVPAPVRQPRRWTREVRLDPIESVEDVPIAARRTPRNAGAPGEWWKDIAFTVSTLSRFNVNPGKAHWAAVKHLFRYLKGTMDFHRCKLCWRP